MISVSYPRSVLSLVLAILALTGCETRPPPPRIEPPQPPLLLPPEASGPNGALHALNRLTFGPLPGQIQEVQAIGIGQWIAQQLTPSRVSEAPSLVQDLARYQTLHQPSAALYLTFQELKRHKDDPEKPANEFANHVTSEAREAHLLQAIESRRQFQEVLVTFWYNHFNVFAGKGMDRLWAGTFERDAIRPYVFGRFRDLLEATARHPAMLFYLDNWQNTAPGSRGVGGNEQGLNENYARELMELHTLGVDGGYSQNDVIALARIFTGWGLRQRGERGRPADYSFVFDPNRHDFSDKVFLNYAIRGQGPMEVELALGVLSASPKTANHLSYQLAQYFVSDTPDPGLVAAMAKAYLASGGELTAVYRAMIEHPAFWSAETKFKTPFEYVVSSVRAAGVTVTTPGPLIGTIQQLGQPIFGYETPDGYKWTEATWISQDGLARRLNFATTLASGRMALNGPPPTPPVPVDEKIVLDTLGGDLSPQTRAAVADAKGPMRSALLLGSPDFMHR